LSLGPRPEKSRARRVRGNSAELSAKSDSPFESRAPMRRSNASAGRTSDFALRSAAHTMRHAKNYSNVVVRWSGGRGGKFLRLGVQKEFEGQTDHPLRGRRISRKERPGD